MCCPSIVWHLFWRQTSKSLKLRFPISFGDEESFFRLWSVRSGPGSRGGQPSVTILCWLDENVLFSGCMITDRPITPPCLYGGNCAPFWISDWAGARGLANNEGGMGTKNVLFHRRNVNFYKHGEALTFSQ